MSTTHYLFSYMFDWVDILPIIISLITILFGVIIILYRNKEMRISEELIILLEKVSIMNMNINNINSQTQLLEQELKKIIELKEDYDIDLSTKIILKILPNILLNNKINNDNLNNSERIFTFLKK